MILQVALIYPYLASELVIEAPNTMFANWVGTILGMVRDGPESTFRTCLVASPTGPGLICHHDQLSALTNEIVTAGAVSLNLTRLENSIIAGEVSRTDG